MRAHWIGCLVCLAMIGCSSRPSDEVVVYVAVDRGQAEPILSRFQAETGITVRAVYDAEAAKTTGLVTRLVAEAGRPRCDVFWNNELAQTLLLADRRLLDAYRSAAAHDIPEPVKDPQGQWTGVATRARVIVYNTQLVKESEAPRSLVELTHPKWRGKVAIANPQFGTTRTHIAALFGVLGESQAQQWLSDLKQNDVRIVDGNAIVKNLVARADPDASPILVGLTDTDDVASGKRDGEPIDFRYPDQETHGTLVIPSTVCLIRGAPHAEAARRLIDFLVGPETERQLTVDASGYRPVRPASKSSASSLPEVNAMEIDSQTLLKTLEPSSRWTQEHFQP